jgi:flagellar transcriptional activator FlhD
MDIMVAFPLQFPCRKFSYMEAHPFPTRKSESFRFLEDGLMPIMQPSTNALGEKMKANELTTEIKELNLTYLMLAQQMVLADKDMAIFRLGISKDIADILAVLTPSQILKLSNSNMMLCRIRVDDNLVFGMLANYGGKEKTMSQSHAAILMAGQSVEEIA